MRIRAITYDAEANAGDPDRNVHCSKEISDDIIALLRTAR